MRDDADFNIMFVQLIEKNPCLYDYTHSGYCRRDIQDKAWGNIANEVVATVSECRDRWKNIRGCYTRFIKAIGPSGNGAKRTKAYDLTEHLGFLETFTKSRKSKGNFPEPLSERYRCMSEEREVGNDYASELDDSSANNQYEIDEPINPSSSPSLEMGPSSSAPKKMRISKQSISIEDVNKSALEYFRAKNEARSCKEVVDPDLDFLKSVLPDMKDMTSSQKRRFKIGILNLAGEILNEPRAEPFSQAGSRSLNNNSLGNTTSQNEMLMTTTYSGWPKFSRLLN